MEFLAGEAKVLEKDMMNKFKNSEDKYVNEINNIISSAIEKELLSKIDEMSKMSIAYAEAIAGGDSINAAKIFASSSFRKINLEEKNNFRIRGSSSN